MYINISDVLPLYSFPSSSWEPILVGMHAQDSLVPTSYRSIDAVYHTSIVLEEIEYFFGAGVQTAYAGSTHHGRPMETVNLGRTNLPIEIVLEYLESLKQIYTAEVSLT